MIHPHLDPGLCYEQDLPVQTVDKRPLNNDMRRVFKMLEQIFAQFQVLKANTSLTGDFQQGVQTQIQVLSESEVSADFTT